MITRNLRIHGRVQGVWYRAWTIEEASALGLSGWVRNRADGTVEACVHGPPEQVEALIQACHKGPPSAQATKIDVSECGYDDLTSFEQKPTL